MKRNLVIASITAAALIGGGTYTAVATGATDSGADTAPKTVSSASLVNDDDRDDRNEPGDDRDDRDDNGGSGDDAGGKGKDGTSAAGQKLTAAQAAAAALKQHPGKVESVDLDDDDDDDRSSAGRHWEVDIIGQDGMWYDLRVDASTGAVRADNDDDNDDDDDDRQERAAVRGAEVDAQGAAAAALKKHPGAVTSVDSDDNDRKAGHWEVTVRGDDGRTHEVTVDMSSGAVAADRDDHDDRDDDRHDDRDDDDRGDDDGDDD
ncbi:PepSY domain-containing protein [Streptomyces sp. NBC_00838]|uniref:PepSY domain-containing protein n=1 Tax=Streptomyces sp. NBC_00838 TaxID=2903680 RepID=UPI00386D4078|nr:PepSY domain-containing protein [Streptomyces sp. NBC_00838]